MASTALSLIQQACYSANVPAPSAIVANADTYALQLLQLFYDTGRELRQKRWWPQLKKPYSIQLQQGRTNYQLPQDFYAALPETQWDQQNKWEMLGPMSDRLWDYRLYGYVTTENRKAYRVFGPDMNPNSGGGQFQVNPQPDYTLAGLTLTFEYITKSWLTPPNWAANTAYTDTGPTMWVNSGGNVYKCTTGGTSGTVSPNMANGQGQEGGLFWTALSVTAWAPTTYYSAGDFVTNGGKLYQCTYPGQSAGSGGPTGTSTTAVTDGTVQWLYCAAAAWAGETLYGVGAFVTKTILAATVYFKCTTPSLQNNNTQFSGKTGPNWDTIHVSDGGAVWTYQAPAYEALVTDNDLVLFDDEIMIAGLKWRFMRARGLDYEDLKTEYELMVDTAMSRWMPGQRFSLSGVGPTLAGLNPNIPEGNFNT